jgi:hypothetical protein
VSAYRLVVREAGKPRKQGTAWLLRPDLAVTAFHVVGESSARAWLHEKPGSGGAVTYHLLGEHGEVPLEPVACDLRADVALLRCREALAAPAMLPLAETPPARGATFHAEGYPGFHGGERFTISGEVTEVRGDASGRALQLLIDQGTEFSWEGVSGSAIQIDGRVVGVVTQETGRAATGWGASAEAVRRLERIQAAGDLRKACCGLLLRLYPDPAHVVHLRADLGWPAEGAEDRAVAAMRLVERAALEGVDGLIRLLDEVGNDHPASNEVQLLRRRVLGRVRQGLGTGAPSRAQQAREILQVLGQRQGVGVAILEPLGFQARAVVEEAIAQLQRPDEALLPVRFVPERRTTGDERLYGTLLRDLRHALPEPWKRYVDERTEKSAMDRFESAVEALLSGPVHEARRKLLFVIEGLARVPAEQLEQWGFLLARLSNRGLKLLVWGGQELHDLRTLPAGSGRYSAFHVLKEARIGELSAEEVRALVATKGGDEAAAAVVYAETGGHPALVGELLDRYAEEACAGDREAIAARILDGAHMGRLRWIVEGEAELQERLRGFAAIEEGKPLPRGRKRGEGRLEWLGILKDAGARNWSWVAPVMREFAREWVV